MKKLLIGTSMAAMAAIAAFAVTAASAEDIKLGVILGYTGPIESLTPDMAAGAELAIKEVSMSGALLGGSKVMPVRGDTTCTDSAAATAATERLVTSDKIKAIVGGDCSGVTTAML
ncbi:MAG: ABC transporter substrate-binding protein, partial [Rhodospirillaceae bacterium]|nr:ABC transporter substrate-binding protein [Rhodospirillaceae bacterium]